MESDHQEQSCLELIAELKLAQDGVFKIPNTKVLTVFFFQPTLFMLKHNDIMM